MNIYQVDSFTNKPFTGNPAGVCPADAPLAPELMQAVAAEMNVAETAFFWPETGGAFRLKWFSPLTEVDLCGHGTLAAAHVMHQAGLARHGDTVRFHTNSGLLTAAIGRESFITLDFPGEHPEDMEAPAGLGYALGAVPAYIGAGRGDILVHLKDEEAVRTLQPNIDLIAGLDCRGVIVTAHADDADVDFVSRFFAPAIGVDEDPVTGSTHCILGPYWARLLGKNELASRQLSKRGGGMKVRVNDDRVELTGTAVTVIEGQLFSG